MAIVRWRPRREWDPFAGMFNLARDLADVFPLTSRLEQGFGEWTPAVDVYADDEKVVVRADLPGMKQEEVEVSFHDGILTIKGERKHEAEVKEEGYHCVERACGAFHRAVRVPAEVDGAKAKAELKDGILTITFPKAEWAKARKIKIESKITAAEL